jgi:hypothetical protein
MADRPPLIRLSAAVVRRVQPGRWPAGGIHPEYQEYLNIYDILVLENAKVTPTCSVVLPGLLSWCCGLS